MMRGQIFVEGTPPTILPLSTYPPPCAIPRVIPAPNARGTHAARTGRRRQAQAGAGRRRRIGAHVSHGRAKVLPVFDSEDFTDSFEVVIFEVEYFGF